MIGAEAAVATTLQNAAVLNFAAYNQTHFAKTVTGMFFCFALQADAEHHSLVTGKTKTVSKQRLKRSTCPTSEVIYLSGIKLGAVSLLLCVLLFGCQSAENPSASGSSAPSPPASPETSDPAPEETIPDLLPDLPEESDHAEEDSDHIDPLKEASRVSASESSTPPAAAEERSTSEMQKQESTSGQTGSRSETKRESESSAEPAKAAAETVRASGPPAGETQPEDPVILDDPALPTARTIRESDVDIQSELLALINAEREQHQLDSLEQEDALQFAAEIRAEEALDALSHTRPNGQPYHTVFDEAGFSYSGKWHGENLALIRTSEEDYDEAAIAVALFLEWKESAGHQQNMLSENFLQTGLGVSIQKDDEEQRIVIGAAQLFAGS